jgi:hypothetical protein
MFYALLGTLLIVLVLAGAALSLFFRRAVGSAGHPLPEVPGGEGASR